MTVTPAQPVRPPEKKLVSNPRGRAFRSTVVQKYVMAGSGLLMILWLLAHMYGNLKVFEGQDGFDSYAHHLRTLGTPILPEGGFLWISRVVLLVAIGLHIYSAATLWKRDRAAVGGSSRYETKQNKRGVQRSYASFTMRWGGVIVILFIVYHLLHLSANNTIHPGGESDSAYQRMLNGFDLWYVTLSYTIALLAIGFHIRHGIWSAFTTLGANRSPARRRNLNLLALIVSLVLVIGFLIPPWSIFFGWVDINT